MDEQKKRTEAVRDLYTSMKEIWSPKDYWHGYVHRQIVGFIDKTLGAALKPDDTILNAGSGGSEYDIPGRYCHVDLAENKINTRENYVVASVEDLPFPNGQFDATICVGSVVNYCSAKAVIAELSRTLKPGGLMVFEYERSNSGEFLFKGNRGKEVTTATYQYNGQTHKLNMYSEAYIDRLMEQNGFEVLKKHRFHIVSAVLNGIIDNENLASHLHVLDKPLYFLSYAFAHNTIELCRKRA